VGLILLYLTSVAIFFVFSVGYEHGDSVEDYDALMYKGGYEYRVPWVLHITTSLIWPCAIPSLLIFFHKGGWVWPKKGVTYLKDKDSTDG